MNLIRQKIKVYWPLIKSLQTGLLLLTGLTGYISARCPVLTLYTVGGLLGSLFLAISGSTVLNMVWDRDIDSRMNRTHNRPLPSGKIKVREAVILGLLLSSFGVAWAAFLDIKFAFVVFSGLFIDVVIYTIWLKRKTAWSIVWGGVSGGMPILAGRVLGIGEIDSIGVLFAIGILLWIPTHILTFSIKYSDDYKKAGIPTFPEAYGVKVTRIIIAASSFGAAVSMIIAGIILELSTSYLRLITVMTFVLIGLAIATMIRPSEKMNFSLFKFASIFMMVSMILIIMGVY